MACLEQHRPNRLLPSVGKKCKENQRKIHTKWPLTKSQIIDKREGPIKYRGLHIGCDPWTSTFPWQWHYIMEHGNLQTYRVRFPRLDKKPTYMKSCIHMTSASNPGPSPSASVAPQFLLSALVLSSRLCQALPKSDLVAENDVDLRPPSFISNDPCISLPNTPPEHT